MFIVRYVSICFFQRVKTQHPVVILYTALTALTALTVWALGKSSSCSGWCMCLVLVSRDTGTHRNTTRISGQMHLSFMNTDHRPQKRGRTQNSHPYNSPFDPLAQRDSEALADPKHGCLHSLRVKLSHEHTSLPVKGFECLLAHTLSDIQPNWYLYSNSYHIRT